MRNKTGIITLTIIITALSLFYLSFTLVSRGINEEANEYAADASGKINYFAKQAYLDSLWNKPVYNFLGMEFTYKDVKERELNLGLDLRGGMHVTLEISPVEILVALSGDNPDPDFREALKVAESKQASSQATFTELFFQSLSELAPNKSLASIFANSANRGRIDFGSTDEQVRKVIEEEVEGAIDRAFNVIRTRIDKFGVSQPVIQRIQGTGRIQLELPGVDNPQRIRKLLQGVAKLEFLEVWTPQEFSPYLTRVNDYLVKKKKAEKAVQTENTTEELVTESEEAPAAQEEESLFDSEDINADSAAADSLLQELAEPEVSDLFLLLRARDALLYSMSDTGKINKIINDEAVQALLPPDLQFMWDVKPIAGADNIPTENIMLYAVRKSRISGAPLTGEVIVDANQSFDQRGMPDVSMSMNIEGAKKWKKLTGKNVNKQIAIALDGYVYSAPNVIQEIAGGNSSITGNFTVEEAKDLANVLKAGKLPAPTRIVEEVVVGPSLGMEAQNQGIISVVAGLIVVVLFMIAYYSKGGMVANIALVINIFFILGVLAQLGAALTLPGIAGIVLTIGMSIDANVLIFERIREELKKDSENLMGAINQGYDRAFWTIFDSNLTTFLTGIFLYSFGSGPVKGFAVTLMIGIACSFFSAVFITRVIVSWMTKKGNQSNISFVTPLSKALLSAPNFNFMSKRKIAYAFSTGLIIIGIGVIATSGLNLGVDFQGGRSYVIEFKKDVVPSEIEVAIKKGLEGADIEAKTFGSSQKLKITTNYLVENESSAADSLVMNALVASVESFTGDTYEPAEELLAEGKFIIPSTSKVGATIADDIAASSFKAVLFSLMAIFFYIWVRFRNWRFGLGAVVALFHDSLIVLSVYSIANLVGLSLEIDQVFIAAMLTVIGYSINDTVVVFDRVREYINLGIGHSYIETLNESVNSTLSRTLITSVTTLIVILILLFFGGEVLRGFSFALMVGILIGTYSSIFVATPIVYDTRHLLENKEDKEKENA
ncbi:protein translocase subunit SecDF [Flammeovirgaceae bacterium SG7u.111]|nr:protein translocase subunit SecDF [Flammeovirgaceae bacterium SG7u.132]WPO35899.1 protein translocase subunit SecDF [Flammeovirgaceae bacterium SG7u.111]